MDSSNTKKSSNKYENQILLRKAKLEKMRRERELLQLEKLMREMAIQENLEEVRLKRETREKAKQINNLEIDKIQNDINKLNENSKNTSKQTVVLKPQTNEEDKRTCDKMLKLKCCSLPITEIPPRETVIHSKQTQTDLSRLYIPTDDYVDDDLEYQDDVSPLRLVCKFSSNLPPGILSPGLPKLMDIPPALTPIDKENPWKEKNKKILEEQCEAMMLSQDFHKSLKRVSLAMEKVISRNKNINVDYIGGVNDENMYDSNSKGLLSLNHVFFNKHLTENRCVTCIDWSTHCPDQIATSYYKNEQTSFASGADVIIWNRNFCDQTAEHIFHCHSSVMAVCFTKFNPNLIIGATYSGQIVLWDNRLKTSIPVQCTKLNYKAHTQPIYCLRVIGDDSSHNIISISSDGKLCSWNLDMLALPLDVMQLQLDVSEKIKKPIAVNCMDFSSDGSVVLGGEDGYIYSAFRYGYESGINKRYEKHEAPVTSISTPCYQASPDVGNLFLTSSIDGTIKLWSLESSRPLQTFKNNYDYAMDVAWSPVHPALFVAADGSGHLDLYNLNENILEPIISIIIKEETAINRVAWNTNGQHVAIGTEKGELYLYNTADDLANPVNDEWSNFSNSLRDIYVNYDIECCE